MIPLPEWPDPKSELGKTFFANARAYFVEWKSFGVSNPFALGFLANAEAESSLDPRAENPREQAYGLHQWHMPRIQAIKANTDIDITTFPSIADQVRAARWEILTYPALGYLNTIDARTASAAGEAVCKYFERAGAADAMQRRGAMAERWAVWFQENP